MKPTFIDDEWLSIPNMVNCRHCHSLVGGGGKLFVIGFNSHTCEVFDNGSKPFVIFRSQFLSWNKAISIGNKILNFQ